MNTLVIDGGASAAKWRLHSETGALLGSGIAGPLDGHVYDDDARAKTRATLVDILRALPPGQPAQVAVAGVAGLDANSPASRWYVDALAETLGVAPVNCLAADDLGMVYLGNFDPGDGMIVYAGTGSIAVHITADKRVIRAGGYGYLIDDAGGGFWIGRQALQAFLIALERGPIAETDILFRQMLELFDSDDWGVIKTRTYRGGRRFIASLSRQVVASAELGDPGAIDILHRAAARLADLASRLFAQLDRPRAPVKFIGGIAGVSRQLDAAFAAGLGPDTPLIPGGVAGGEAIYLAYRKYGLATLRQILS
jgi:N-acetylglucosamine kinase-like BadF-type ATPase